MISSVFDYSLDYVLGCYGLLMLLAAIEVYRMRWRDVLWYPWKWLSSFAILQTIHAWSVVASVSIGLEHIYCVTGFYMLCLSFLCLLEFGVRSMTGKRGAVWRMIAVPLILAVITYFTANRPIQNMIVMLLALVSSIVAAYAMLRPKTSSYVMNRRILSLGAVAIVLCGTTTYIGMLSDQSIHLSCMSLAAFTEQQGIPVEYYQLAAAAMFFIFVMLYAKNCNEDDARKFGKDRVTPYQLYVAVYLVAALIIGAICCKQGGQFGQHQFRKSLVGRAQTAAANISPQEVERLYETDAPQYRGYLDYFREQLGKVRAVNADTRFVYLLGKKNNKVVFLADCEDKESPVYSPPMQVYTEADETTCRMFTQNTAGFDDPSEDRWGVFVSAYAPIINQSKQVVAVVGMDVTGQLWLKQIARYRLAVIMVCFAMTVVFVVMGSSYILTRDALLNREYSQTRFRRVFDSAPEGILIVAIDDSTILAANKQIVKWLAVRVDEIRGQLMSRYMQIGEYLPSDGQELVIMRAGTMCYLQVTRAEISYQSKPSYLYFMRDITLRRHAESAKEQLLTELQETNTELQQIIHAVAHDLKAPTRSISTLAQWIKTDYKNHLDASANEMLNTIIERSYRTDRLLSGLLEFMRIGRIQPIVQAVNLKRLVDEVLDECHARERSEIVVMVPDEANIDAGLIRIVLSELVENAVSHGYAKGSPVVISAKILADCFTIYVRDYGVGVAPRYHARIFDLFETLSPKDESGQLGLGLALVKKVVQRMGGDISFRSNSDIGTIVSVSIPNDAPQV